MLAKVKGDYLECYGWKDGDVIEIINEINVDLPEKFYKVKNLDRNDFGTALEYQIDRLYNSKSISFFDKLKLQIDNLELMYNEFQQGKGVASSVYWQVETLKELLYSFEEKVGADKVREDYNIE